jgi:hypothetical protein
MAGARRPTDRLRKHRQQVAALAPQDPDGDAPNQRNLGHGLDQFHQPVPRDQARQTLERIETAQVRLQRFGGKIPAAEKERRQQRCQISAANRVRKESRASSDISARRTSISVGSCTRSVVDHQTTAENLRPPAAPSMAPSPRMPSRQRSESGMRRSPANAAPVPPRAPVPDVLRRRFGSFEVAFLSHFELSC